MRPDTYIAVVNCTAAIEMKIKAKLPPITPTEVREAVVLTPLVAADWVWDKVRGYRLMVVGTTYAGRILRVVLYPTATEDGVWNLGTAIATVRD